MEIKPFYSMKKKTFCVLLPLASYRVACFNDLQNKLVSFPVLIFIYILLFPIGESKIC